MSTVETVEQVVARRELTWLERRKLGLTPVGIRQALLALRDEGVDVANTDVDLLAVAVAKRICSLNTAAWQEVGRDWPAFFDAVVQFLQNFLPMLIELLKLFGLFV